MSRFEHAWLALREPIDHAARSAPLAAGFAAAVGQRPTLIDLGCGTGSNLRYLSPRLGSDQSWLCLDHDRRLLAGAADAVAAWGEARGLVPERCSPALLELRGAHSQARVALIEHDLHEVQGAFGLEGVHGVTASAFLDLVSPAWAEALARRLGRGGIAALFALTYDGRLEWQPEQEDDREMAARFNQHQRTGKGFGPALGPDAVPYLAKRLEAEGCLVQLADSDWHIDAAGELALLGAFLDGLIGAAREILDDRRLGQWARLRRRQLGDGRLGLRVGHLDLLALPRAEWVG